MAQWRLGIVAALVVLANLTSVPAGHAAIVQYSFATSGTVRETVADVPVGGSDRLFADGTIISGTFEYDATLPAVQSFSGEGSQGPYALALYRAPLAFAADVANLSLAGTFNAIVVLNDDYFPGPVPPGGAPGPLVDLLYFTAQPPTVGPPVYTQGLFGIQVTSSAGEVLDLVNVVFAWQEVTHDFLSSGALPGTMPPNADLAQVGLEFQNLSLPMGQTAVSHTVFLEGLAVPAPPAGVLALTAALTILGRVRRRVRGNSRSVPTPYQA